MGKGPADSFIRVPRSEGEELFPSHPSYSWRQQVSFNLLPLFRWMTRNRGQVAGSSRFAPVCTILVFIPDPKSFGFYESPFSPKPNQI